MKKKYLLFVAAISFALFCNTPMMAQNHQNNSHQHHGGGDDDDDQGDDDGGHHANQYSQACDLRSDMRMLWEDHIEWTRNVIFNIIDGLPGTNEAVTRLLRNQGDIGNLFGVYYGMANGSQLTHLLYGHINTAAAILIGLHNNDTAAVNAANAAWYANGDSIVDFLYGLNPNHWSHNDLDMMMDMHLDLTAAEAVARYTMNYAADVAAYDSVHAEILRMADFFTDGIIAQFSGQFRMRLVLTTDGSLEQNSPNPFNDKTVIHFYIPEGSHTASVRIVDYTGRTIKTMDVSNTGKGEIDIDAASLDDGIYTYSLIVDGKTIATHSMVHQR
jgi:hypothetical protein